MTDHPAIRKKLVFHIGGYDPSMVPEAAYRRFVRELRRFENTWKAEASVSPPTVEADQATWDITTTGPNWRVETRYCLVRWDDVIGTVARQPWWRRIVFSQLGWIDFAVGGALVGYMRTSWRYALFFIYPFLIFDAFVIAAWLLGGFVASVSDSVWIGAAAALVVFVGFLRGPCRWLGLATLFDDWTFSSAYVHGGYPVLDHKLDVIAKVIDAAARNTEADEILVIGHSLGAVIAVDLLARVLALNPLVGENTPKVAFLSVGSSILKIGLHRGAKRFHAALQRVAGASGIFWTEYQALIDVMNFYKTNPVSEIGLKTTPDRPVLRIVKISSMLDPVSYERIRRNFYRVHNQFVSGNERRTAYDYFMLVCGPLSARLQAKLPNGPASAFEPDGTLISAAHDSSDAAGSALAARR
ncbi:hypothetical protein [Afipia birgiae]|jgi:hypothetical protein|uniref:hypothetical protein n=1 Tax=Afipia birgiae TaxID=151414 RepID=UPI00037ADB21|nr:hypothetical protein [Afipia birgiae]MBX9822769.1 hypothetical protein [Afipia birgiae]